MAGTVRVEAAPYAVKRDARTWSLTRGISLAIFLILGIGLALRYLAALRLPLELDEQNSLLALRVVADRGIPLLPSGVLYLHGAVVSYLLAPLQKLGIGSIDDLFPLRLVSILVGTATIFVTYRLALRVAGAALPALAAAALLALDPMSIYWSSHVRMYAYAQLFVAIAILCFVEYIMAKAERDVAPVGSGWLAGLVLAFWLAVFSHLSAALLWPALALVALVRYGRGLFGRQRALSVALAACLLAPLVLVGLTTFVGRGATTRTATERDWLPGLSFLGDENIDLSRVTSPSLQGWLEMFNTGPLAALVPAAIIALSGLLVGRYLLAATATPGDEQRRLGIGTMIAVYWIPILLVAFFSPDPAPRYFLVLQPAGAIIAGLGLGALASSVATAQRGWWRQPAAVTLVAVTALLTLHSVAGAWMTGMNDESQKGDLRPALHFVAEHRAPDDLVLVSQAPVSYLVLGDTANLRFLPGDERSFRAQRYVRTAADGAVTDYWIGIPAIASVGELCQVLQAQPGSWIVVDEQRLERRNGFSGPMGDVITGATSAEFAESGGNVYRALPSGDWNNKANRACQEAS